LQTCFLGLLGPPVQGLGGAILWLNCSREEISFKLHFRAMTPGTVTALERWLEGALRMISDIKLTIENVGTAALGCPRSEAQLCFRRV